MLPQNARFEERDLEKEKQRVAEHHSEEEVARAIEEEKRRIEILSARIKKEQDVEKQQEMIM